jgi:DNA-binding transcriptional ArsR family regulator
MTDVFHAIADPTRRALLDRLRQEGPLSVTSLSKPLPMSRQAVRKHLAVLEGAGLIQCEVRGRERIHRLRDEPLQALDAWLARYAAAWDERLDRLKTHVDGGEE